MEKRQKRQLQIAMSIAAITTLIAGTAAGQSRTTIGAPGTGEITVQGRLVEASRFHRQGFTVDGPFERKISVNWNATLAVADSLALHLGTGWAEFFASSGGSPSGARDKHDGRQDTTLGLTWRVHGQTPPDGPSAAVKIGGRIPGPYDPGYTNSLGDGATELQGSVVLENFENRLRWSTEFGYRRRTHAIVNPAGIGEPNDHYEKVDVPNEAFAFAGAYGQLNDQLQIGVEYSTVNGERGLDIGLEGWRPDQWPALHEDLHAIAVTLHVDAKRFGGFALSAGKVTFGRNTPAYRIYTLSWTRRFGRPWRGNQ